MFTRIVFCILVVVLLTNAFFQAYDLGYQSCEWKYKDIEWKKKEKDLDDFLKKHKEERNIFKMPKADE